MGGSDLNTQLRALYSNDRRSKRWLFALFYFIIDASIINATVIYRLSAKERQKTTYEKFIKEVTLELVNHQGGIANARKREPRIHISPDKATRSSHHIMSFPWKKKKYCFPCRTSKTPRPAGPKKRPLGKTSGNAKKRRRRSSQTHYGCEACKRPCCRKTDCWEQLHWGVDKEDVENVLPDQPEETLDSEQIQ